MEYGGPVIIEFASYRAREEGAPGSRGIRMVELSEAERELKRKMIAAHVTQQATIGGFQVDSESFRLTRAYDFTRPPHDGALHYEHYDWGMTGERFRTLAAQALQELGLTPPI